MELVFLQLTEGTVVEAVGVWATMSKLLIVTVSMAVNVQNVLMVLIYVSGLPWDLHTRVLV
ncbi:MAG: hypothetical protein PHG63_03400 [Candidatus Dojkabacteria bacterium]|nr:hypothetical protein [Candidatus Dojkabacteria bacterium]